MEEKSWPVAVITSSFALLVTLFFLLIPSLAAVVVTDQQVKQISEEREAQKEEAARGVAIQVDSVCLVLSDIIEEIRVVQMLEKPFVVTDVAPIEYDLRLLQISDSELAGAVSRLAYRFEPNFVVSQVSGTVSLNEVLLAPGIESRIDRVQEICSR